MRNANEITLHLCDTGEGFISSISIPSAHHGNLRRAQKIAKIQRVGISSPAIFLSEVKSYERTDGWKLWIHF